MTKKINENLTKSEALSLSWKKRKDSKGHTKNNVVPCCYVCNIVRSNIFSFDEMKILGKTIKEIKKCRLEKINSSKNMD